MFSYFTHSIGNYCAKRNYGQILNSNFVCMCFFGGQKLELVYLGIILVVKALFESFKNLATFSHSSPSSLLLKFQNKPKEFRQSNQGSVSNLVSPSILSRERERRFREIEAARGLKCLLLNRKAVRATLNRRRAILQGKPLTEADKFQ